MREHVQFVFVGAGKRARTLRALEALLRRVHVLHVRLHVVRALEGLRASGHLALELLLRHVTQRVLPQLVLVREDLAAHVAKVVVLRAHDVLLEFAVRVESATAVQAPVRLAEVVRELLVARLAHVHRVAARAVGLLRSLAEQPPGVRTIRGERDHRVEASGQRFALAARFGRTLQLRVELGLFAEQRMTFGIRVANRSLDLRLVLLSRVFSFKRIQIVV